MTHLLIYHAALLGVALIALVRAMRSGGGLLAFAADLIWGLAAFLVVSTPLALVIRP